MIEESFAALACDALPGLQGLGWLASVIAHAGNAQSRGWNCNCSLDCLGLARDGSDDANEPRGLDGFPELGRSRSCVFAFRSTMLVRPRHCEPVRMKIYIAMIFLAEKLFFASP